MNAATLIRVFADAGIHLSARGDKLHYEAPPGALTPDLRQRLVDAKAELLALLAVRRAWIVTIPGRPPFTMMDPKGCTRAEAERVARLKWPGATVTPNEDGS